MGSRTPYHQLTRLLKTTQLVLYIVFYHQWGLQSPRITGLQELFCRVTHEMEQVCKVLWLLCASHFEGMEWLLKKPGATCGQMASRQTFWSFEFGHFRDSVGLGSVLHRIIQLPLREFTSSHVRQESFWQCPPLVNMASRRTWRHSFNPNLMAWLQPHSCIIWSSRGLSHFKHCFGFAVVQHGLKYYCPG